MHLKDISLHDNLNDLSQKTLARQLLKAKSDEFFAILEAKIGEQELAACIGDFIDSKRFSCCELDDFCEMMQDNYALDLKEDLQKWYARNGLPGYVITDSSSQEVIANNRTFNQIRFTVHNLEPVEGFILIRGIETDKFITDDWATYITSIDGNQSKEISMLFEGSQVQIEIHTFLSQNLPNRIIDVFTQSNIGENSQLFEGENLVQKQYIYEKPGEIIIDNEDPGFQIIKEKPRWQFLQSLIQPEDFQVEFPREFLGYDVNTHETWSYLVSMTGSFFGLYAKTSYVISKGNGQNRVQWTAMLPESGEYDIFYYTYYFNLQEIFPSSYLEKRYPHLINTTTIGNYNFFIYHDNGIEKIKRKISDYYDNSDLVEVHLGTYYFSEGPAKIELTDETNGLYVFADAVKWVKR